MTRSLALVLATSFVAAVSSLAVAQDTHAQHAQKQDTTKKAMMHDMSKMKDHDMSKMKDHDMSKMMEHMRGPWKEMNAFHELLAATYHPATKDTLQPLREKAAELAAAAKTWSTAEAPPSCNSDATRKTVEGLATDAQAIAAQVAAKASDADLKKSITALHERFKSVEMKCGGHRMMEMKH